MKVSNFVTFAATVFLLGAGLAVRSGDSGAAVYAQEGGGAPATAKPAVPYDPPVDPYDRNLTLWAHERSGAKSGWQRGRELFFQNCWMCHSEYVVNGDTRIKVPSLRDVAKRLTDPQITMMIQNGSTFMPAFKQLTDADIKDLISLFREKCGKFPLGSGCFDEHNPPPNPLYKFGYDYLTPNAVDAVEAKRSGTQ